MLVMKLCLKNYLIMVFLSMFSMVTMATATTISKIDIPWSGAYIGANAGYSWESMELETLSSPYTFSQYPPSPSKPSGSGTIDSGGFTGGIQGGNNWRWDAFVFGIELDFNSFNTESSASLTNSSSIDHTLQTDWLFTARPRLGYATDNLLLYVTGGLALTRLDISTSSSYVHETVKGSDTRAGWIVGGGIEFLITEDLSLKGEYLYTNFGTVDNLDDYYDMSDTLFTTTINPRANILRAGINYHF